MRTFILGFAAAAMLVPAMATPAFAKNDQRYNQYYDRDGYYSGPTWRGNDGRMYCRRSNGTTGLIIGGAAGALAGRAIDTHGERTTGTIVGAVAGALVGREIERSNNRNRCN